MLSKDATRPYLILFPGCLRFKCFLAQETDIRVQYCHPLFAHRNNGISSWTVRFSYPAFHRCSTTRSDQLYLKFLKTSRAVNKWLCAAHRACSAASDRPRGSIIRACVAGVLDDSALPTVAAALAREISIYANASRRLLLLLLEQRRSESCYLSYGSRKTINESYPTKWSVGRHNVPEATRIVQT